MSARSNDTIWKLNYLTSFNYQPPGVSNQLSETCRMPSRDSIRFHRQFTDAGQTDSRHTRLPVDSSLQCKIRSSLGQTRKSFSSSCLVSIPEEMGKIESRNIIREKSESSGINDSFKSKKIPTGFNSVNGKNNSAAVCNGAYKESTGCDNNHSKEKNKTIKLITSRSPRTNNDHHAIMYAQFKDTSFYDNDFRKRSMSETQAQLRKKVLERRLRLHELEGSSDSTHHVTWADTQGNSLTCELRRRSFSHGSTGLPNKPILKKLSPNNSTESKRSNNTFMAVDTRYL